MGLVGLGMLVFSLAVYGYATDKQSLRNAGVFLMVLGIIQILRSISKKSP